MERSPAPLNWSAFCAEIAASAFPPLQAGARRAPAGDPIPAPPPAALGTGVLARCWQATWRDAPHSAPPPGGPLPK